MKVISDLSVTSARTSLRSQWWQDGAFATASDAVWYDVSDLSTLISNPDATLVSQPGDPIAIVLDKSRGLSLGPELVVNGDYTTDTLGWTTIGSGISFSSVSGRGRLSGSADIGGAYQDIALEDFRVAEVRFRARRIAGTSRARVRVYGFGSFSHLRYELMSDVVDTQFTEHRFLVSSTNGGNRLYFQQAEAFGDAVIEYDDVSIREVLGNHAVQTNLAARPVLQQEDGVYYLYFDGIDDFMRTTPLQPSSDKVQLVSVLQKASGSAQSVVFETSSNADLNNGTLALMAPASAGGDNYRFEAGGTTKASVMSGDHFVAPRKDVLTAQCNIAGASLQLRVNSIVADTSSGPMGTGDFVGHPLFMGQRGSNAHPFHGAIYGAVLRFGPELSPNEITHVENSLSNAAGVLT